MTTARAARRRQELQSREAQAADRMFVVICERTVARGADARKAKGEHRMRAAGEQ